MKTDIIKVQNKSTQMIILMSNIPNGNEATKLKFCCKIIQVTIISITQKLVEHYYFRIVKVVKCVGVYIYRVTLVEHKKAIHLQYTLRS